MVKFAIESDLCKGMLAKWLEKIISKLISNHFLTDNHLILSFSQVKSV